MQSRVRERQNRVVRVEVERQPFRQRGIRERDREGAECGQTLAVRDDGDKGGDMDADEEGNVCVEIKTQQLVRLG